MSAEERGRPGPGPIRVLAPEVASRIAAGEVIERPASVVKELVENALDAGAAAVEIEIEEGGAALMRVSDDGCGIAPSEVESAFLRHATSKLRSEHDLFTVRTLGFRGEALAAVAAAADVELTTRPAGEQGAVRARYRGGELESRGSAPSAPGTAVEVRGLFAQLPARRRFLRSPRAEARAVASVVTDYALCRPAVSFRLRVDGRQALHTPGTGEPRDAVTSVYGAQVASELLPASADRSLREPAPGREQPRCLVGGLVGPPSLHRGSRRYIHLVANGRTISSRALVHAVEEAYRALMPAGRHPVALIRVEVPPGQVDVNVHPRKAEVRFRHEQLVYATVSEAVRSALSGAPAPEAPWLDAPARADGPRPPRGREALASAQPASSLQLPPDLTGAPARPGAARSPLPSGKPVSGRAALPLGERLPALRPLGQFDRLYLVAEGPDGLYLVDQHAAHERVLYERVLTARERGRPERQALLEPVAVALAPDRAELAWELSSELEALGFELSELDGGAVLLRSVPAALGSRDPERSLVDYLDALDAEERLTGPDRALATLACRAAVMAGDRLAPEEQRALLQDLEAASEPHSCPHGRPTVVHLTREALDRSFRRPPQRR